MDWCGWGTTPSTWHALRPGDSLPLQVGGRTITAELLRVRPAEAEAQLIVEVADQ